LIAAGQAAGANPGILVTDSPVAAYYSGKSPTQITGSQSLPLDRDQALQWLRSHGVSSVIVENISYYRATAVFPELARGAPILRDPDGGVLPRTSTTVDLSTTTQSVWRRTFELDEMGGNAVVGGGFDFTPVASRGHIAVTYTVDASGITIEVEALQLAPGYTQVGILN